MYVLNIFQQRAYQKGEPFVFLIVTRTKAKQTKGLEKQKVLLIIIH